MNGIVILAFVAMTTFGLALIHETRLRRAAHKAIRRLLLALRRECRGVRSRAGG